MFWFIIGYVLGIFTFVAWNLQKSGKLSLRWHQWLIVASVLVVLLFTIEKYFSFEVQIERTALGYTVWVLIIPAIILLALLGLTPLWAKKRAQKKLDEGKKKNSENSEEETQKEENI